MKGDINLKINKKLGLVIIAAASTLAMAEYVSIVSAKSSGGITINAPSFNKDELLLEIMPIGSVTLRMDAIDPATIYGGTWQLITGDASLRLGDGNSQSISVKGSGNKKQVPVPEHTHTATQVAHSHARGSMEISGILSSPGYENT